MQQPRHFPDIVYARASRRNRLDLWVPDAPHPPLVVFIHGGAFRLGNKGMVDRFLQPLLEAGFAVASMNYRLSGEAIWPAQRDDLRAAFAFLRREAARYGYDPARIASFGPSAGGHLSAWAGIDLAEDPGTRLAASVCWFPPVDFWHMDADMAASGVTRGAPPNSDAGSPESMLIGAVVADNPDLAHQASPIARLEALPPGTPLPPFLIMHGALDPLIAAQQSRRLAEALTAFGTSPGVELEILPGGTHGGGDFDLRAVFTEVVEFLQAAFALDDA